MCCTSGCYIRNWGAIGAMSLVNKNVEPWTVCAGIPCKKIRDREQKIKEYEQEIEKS